MPPLPSPPLLFRPLPILLQALLMGEEFVLEASQSSPHLNIIALAGGTGTLFLTDRHLLLHVSKRQQVVHSIAGVVGHFFFSLIRYAVRQMTPQSFRSVT